MWTYDRHTIYNVQHFSSVLYLVHVLILNATYHYGDFQCPSGLHFALLETVMAKVSQCVGGGWVLFVWLPSKQNVASITTLFLF